MNFELGGNNPIDPEEFERAFAFFPQDDNLADPNTRPFADDGIQNNVTDDITGGEGTTRVPDPVQLAGLFDAITAFNTAEKHRPRLAYDVIDGLNKARRREEYQAEGMTDQEAIDYIKATEGEHAPEAEVALLDLEGIALHHKDALGDFGLTITSDFTGAHLEISNPVKLTASLGCISEYNLPPQLQSGLNTLLKEFTGGLWATVINNNGQQVDAYGAKPFWMDEYYPEPQEQAQAVAILTHGQQLAAQFERLGVDASYASALRNISRYYDEGMIVEWALGHEMGFDEDPYQPEDIRPLYQQDYDSKYWDSYFRMLDGAEAKSNPGDTFVANQREAATLHITTYLGEILGNIESPLTREKFDAAWPDRDALEMKIAENIDDPYIAKWVRWRSRLQQYGRQGESPA